MKSLANYCIIIVFIMSSCNENKYESIENINVRIEEQTTINASSFIESFKIVKLKTNDDWLIHQVSKVIYENKYIYILDIPGNCIFIFDEDGNARKKIKNIGLGPGEYIQIRDFFVENTNLYLMDYTQQAVLKYDFNFHFVDKIKVKTFASNVIVNDGSYWIYNEPLGKIPDFQFTLINNKESFKKSFLSRNSSKHTYNWGGVNVFYINNQEKFLSPRYNDTIYSIQKSTVKPEFVINFSKQKFPLNENINNFDITDSNFTYLVKSNFYVNEKFLIFDYINGGKRYYCIYDREEKSNISGLINNDLIDNFRFFPKWGNFDYLIEELSIEGLKSNFMLSSQLNEYQNSDEFDNPLIIIYKLKNK